MMGSLHEQTNGCVDNKLLDTYFYASCTSNKKVIPVDIANDSIVDLNVANKKANILTRKTNHPRKEMFSIFSPSLPLDMPNRYKPISPKDLLKECYSEMHKCEYGLRSNVYKQYGRLKKKHHDIFHQSLKNLRGSKNLFDDFFSRSSNTARSFSIRKEGYRGRDRDKERNEKSYAISDFISDIPKELLIQLLDESLFLEHEELEKNYNLKNCLAHYEDNRRVFIFCPVGEHMDYIGVKEILVDHSEPSDHSSSGFKMLKVSDVLKVHVGSLIKEIFITHDDMLHVRCDYEYHVYSISLAQNSCDLTLIRKYNFDKLVHSIGANYDSSNEIYVVAEDRSICQFLGTPEPSKVVSFRMMQDVTWQTCIYGTSRETCLVSNENLLAMFDFRIKVPPVCTYFDISSEYINKNNEKLTPVLCWSPMNQHQYFLSTNQAVLLNDERYLKTPILQFNHYLKSPPYFVQTLYDVQRDDKSMLLCLGSYKTTDSVLYQLFTNEVREVSFGNAETLRCKNPITVTQPLYKLSEYSDWKTYNVNWELSLSPVNNRIYQPCIGFNLIPSTVLDGNSNRYLNVVQQSLCGDLFFQQILSTPCNNETSGDKMADRSAAVDDGIFKTVVLTEETTDNNVVLIKAAKARCKQWIDSIVKNITKNEYTTTHDDIMENNMVEKNIRENIEDSKQGDHNDFGHHEDIASCFNEGFQYDNPHDENITVDLEKVCKDMDVVNSMTICKCENTESSENNTICSKCSDEWRNKISGVRNKCGILTRRSLGLPHITELPLEVSEVLDEVERSNKPLNRLLQTQWDEDKYVSLQEFAPNITFIQYPDCLPSP